MHTARQSAEVGSVERRLRVLIVDDEPPARGVLRYMLQRWQNTIIVGECGTAVEALAAVQSADPDVVFLDVNMPGMNGLQLAAALGRGPQIVFVTAYRDYAAQAFDLAAADYLLKPYSERRFDESYGRALARVRGPGHGVDSEGESTGVRIVVRDRDTFRVVRASEIEWIEAVDVYVRLHLMDGPTLLLREALTDLETRLGDGFLRIHRSYVVNISCIDEVRKRIEGNYELRLQSGTILRMARARRGDLHARLKVVS
jgi:two-component system, LytTR family, response regulator